SKAAFLAVSSFVANACACRAAAFGCSTTIMPPAIATMIPNTMISPRLTATDGSSLHQRSHAAAQRMTPAPITNRWYSSNARVKNIPPESCPPNVLNTAGITAPLNTTIPPTQTASASHSSVRQTTIPQRGTRRTVLSLPGTSLEHESATDDGGRHPPL